MESVYQVTVTVPSRHDARQLVTAMVEARLAACGQVFGPVASTYWWEGEVQSAEEWTIVFKTAAHQSAALAQAIADRHPYEVPEVVAVEAVGGHPGYLRWVIAESSGDGEHTAPSP